ncbi:MAG: DUF389 domain-containing protein [Ilumatobacteraceae bacterium]
MTDTLDGRRGVRAVVVNRAVATEEPTDVVVAEVRDSWMDDVLSSLAKVQDADRIEVAITPLDDFERYRFVDGRPVTLDDADDGLGLSAASSAFRRLIRVDLSYVLLMAAAAVVATAALIGGVPVALVGAMAFSPDLGRLNAMSFAVIAGEGKLLVRAALSLVVGLSTTIVVAVISTFLVATGTVSDPFDAIGDRLVDFVTVLNGVTITIAFASGTAAMVVFITDHGTAAVGVGVSITTMPAAAFAGIAIAEQEWESAGDALVVLAVNVFCAVVAGVVVGLVLRRHLRHRAMVLRERSAAMLRPQSS